MRERLHLAVHGAVQGVGFRPFVYRLAHELDLTGWVLNSAQGVFIEVEGPRTTLDGFVTRLGAEQPPQSRIISIESTWLDTVPYEQFEIRESRSGGVTTAFVLPDIATCDDCRREIFDPGDRRYRYPFTNCTNCGPRFSIIDALPYDRANTTMRQFEMCPACREEYENPLSRRFHAQPNACPACGPRLSLWDRDGTCLAQGSVALGLVVAVLRGGGTAAVKGIGGFHLVVDAANEAAVLRLRERKRREEKPFALMYPSLERIRADCDVDATEERLLRSSEAPIVLLRRRQGAAASLADSVAPGNPYLGVMLPSSPLHHLLLADFGRAIVATSGNVSDEPICFEEHDALNRLGTIADVFLGHDRPIVRHVDDSIVRVMLGREMVLRRARGYAPLPVHLRADAPPVVAVGGHFKNAVVVASGEQAFISQHIGDLESAASAAAFRDVLSSVGSLYDVTPETVVADKHPDYVSTHYARTLGIPMVQVQHHYAHVASCMAENDLAGAVLGVAWDGTGYGDDDTVWGGEFLVTDETSYTRAGSLRTFPLPGGDAAVREPRRAALGVLFAMFGDATSAMSVVGDAFAGSERRLLLQALRRGVNSPMTSSAGRLFDAVAALTSLRLRSSYEGQAAFAVECAVDDSCTDAYPFELHGRQTPFVIDWAPMIRALIDDLAAETPRGTVATRFHNTLAKMIVAAAEHVGMARVVLTGGCFQNRELTERTVSRLQAAGFRPYWHQRVPPNDGGLALGQVVALLRSQPRSAVHVSRRTRQDSADRWQRPVAAIGQS